MPTGIYERTPEHRAKISAVHKGMRHSPEARARMSAAHTGVPLSPERRARMIGAHTTHGMWGTPTYTTWVAMKYRCRNTKVHDYKYYRGRGIIVCDRWLRFENFLADMGERPEGKSIDRIDNDGDYEPGNCRWATAKEQRANRRTKDVGR